MSGNLLFLILCLNSGTVVLLISGSHILELIFIVIENYQYGICLIWAKKPIWGPFRPLMG